MFKQFSPNDPLNEKDTKNQTYGCRAFQPLFCKDYGSELCAVSNKDCICKKPRRGWDKRYEELKGEK